MSHTTKIIAFIIALLVGSFLLYAISPILTYFLVSITGQGWLFVTLKWMLLVPFWVWMFWKCWPRKV